MKNFFYKNILLKLLILSAIIRILTLFLVFEKQIEFTNYWEYGTIAENLINGKGYSLFHIDENNNIQVSYNQNSRPSPSAYMPPGYVILIAPTFLIKNSVIRTNLIFLFQIIISMINLILIYKLSSDKINKNVALFSSIIYIIYPEFIYSCFSIGPTVIYHFLILSLIYFSLKKFNKINLIIIIIVLSLSLYFRFEIVFFWSLISIYYFIKNKSLLFFLPLIIALILLSPWLYRNYIVFNKFPLISTNTGQNLFRGHNNLYPGAWADNKLDEELSKIKFSNRYELERNSLLLSKAINHIQTNIKSEIIITFEKIIHLFGIYYYDDRSFSPIYLISWSILSFLFWYGIIKYPLDNLKMDIIIFLFFHLLLAITFFVIIRYQTMFKISYLPFAGYGLELIIKKFKKN